MPSSIIDVRWKGYKNPKNGYALQSSQYMVSIQHTFSSTHTQKYRGNQQPAIDRVMT